MRFALLALVVACSSSAKQKEVAPAEGSAPVAAQPAGSGSAQTDSWAPKPADPAAELALLRTDIDMICKAAKETGATAFIDIGPHIAERMKTGLLADLFANIRSGNVTLDDIIKRIREGMAKVNVQKCDTVDVLIANDPRKRSPE